MNQCHEVMTKDPVFCLPSDPVNRVANMMRTEGIGPIPVVADAKTKKLVGIVTDRDLTIKVLAEDRDPKTTKVADIMTQGPITCTPEDNLETALTAMTERQVRRIPVVDANHTLVGIISQADVALRIKAPRKTAEVVEQVSKPAA